LAFSPDGGQLAAGWEGLYNTVVVWATPSFEEKARITADADARDIFCLAFRPDGKVLALGGGNGPARGVSLTPLDLDPGKAGLKPAGPGGQVTAGPFSPDGQTLAVAC